VALARSLVTRPTVLLMDEPLSNLDLKLRERMRVELRAMLKEAGATAVYVTHDQADAMVLADRLIVMNAGRVLEAGDPRSIYERPKTEFAARFLGSANIVAFARLTGENGRTYGELEDGRRMRLTPGSAGLRYVIRPEKIALSNAPAGLDEPFECEIVDEVFLGNLSYQTIRCGGLELQVQSVGLSWQPGKKGWAAIPPEAIVPLAD
jgi:iron(III) transport system ATP-binding protein